MDYQAREQADTGETFWRLAQVGGNRHSMPFLWAPPVEGWYEREESTGEQCLRNRASRQLPDAMRRLGERLLDGNGLAANPEEGLYWLRSSASAGDAAAMERLGTRLLDGLGVPVHAGEGLRWLRAAVDCGLECARINWALRHLYGVGVPVDVQEGMGTLQREAAGGSTTALAVLSAYFIESRGSAGGVNQPEAAEHLLRQAGAILPESIEYLGFRAFAAGSQSIGKARSLQYGKAATLFWMAHQLGQPSAGTSLAYLLRRNVVDNRSTFPGLQEILEPLRRTGDGMAIMNEALWIASNWECDEDLERADHMVAGIVDPAPVSDWWQSLARYGDSEGHLVLGWLTRHALIADPDEFPVRERIELAKRGGWRVPNWT